MYFFIGFRSRTGGVAEALRIVKEEEKLLSDKGSSRIGVFKKPHGGQE